MVYVNDITERPIMARFGNCSTNCGPDWIALNHEWCRPYKENKSETIFLTLLNSHATDPTVNAQNKRALLKAFDNKLNYETIHMLYKTKIFVHQSFGLWLNILQTVKWSFLMSGKHPLHLIVELQKNVCFIYSFICFELVKAQYFNILCTVQSWFKLMRQL